MTKIKVTLSRVYEYTKEEVENYLYKENNYLHFLKKPLIENNPDSIKRIAVDLAMTDFSEELMFFESTPEDFVSSKVEVI